jgi:hypothetical protein
MPARQILEALETGKMRGMASDLVAADREAIVKHLGLADAASLIPTSARCSASPQFLKAAPRVERLERSSQHPLPIRRFRRASGLRHSQIEAQLGVRVSERHHRLCAANRCRRNVVRW